MDVVYSAEPQLRAPGAFFDALWRDVRISPSVARQLFMRRLQAGYRRSRLGYVWLLLPPLATTAVWVALNAARVLQAGHTDIPYPVFVLSGTVLWQLFVDALNAPLQQLTASRSMLTKTRIPHEAVLLAGVMEVAFNFVIRAMVVLAVVLWYSGHVSPVMLLAPIGIAAVMLLGLAGGLLLSPAGLLYSDVARAISLATGVLLFLTPVLYPLPERGPAALLRVLNPVAPVLTTARNWLTASSLDPARGFVAVVVASLLVLAASWLLYRVARPHLVARL